MKGTTAVLLKAFLVRSSEITDFHHTSATNFRQTVKMIIHRLTEALCIILQLHCLRAQAVQTHIIRKSHIHVRTGWTVTYMK